MTEPYRILVVDDEPEIRKGIKMKVDWAAIGAVVAAEAANGQEALACLEKEAFDIVITDMHMPLMNGVELLQACSEHYPHSRLIVLTGYDDFLYAKAAVRSRVHDYLLKPVVQLELVEALTKIIRELEAERLSREKQHHLEWQMSRDRISLREQFVLLGVKGTNDQAVLWRDEARRVGMSHWERRHVAFAAFDPGAGPDRSSFRLPFELLCRELADSFGRETLVFRDPGFPHMMFVAAANDEFENHESFVSNVGNWGRQARQTIERLLGLPAALGVGKLACGFAEWKYGYLSALLACSEYREHTPGQRHPSPECEMTPETERQLVYMLKSGKLDDFKSLIRDLISTAERHSHRQWFRTLFYICQAMESVVHSYAITLEPDERIWLHPHWFWQEGDTDSAVERLSRVADRIGMQIARINESRDDGLFDAVRAFIDEHYASDITLTALAERYHFNPSYFSELFRLHIGQPFSEYLADVRMTQAAKALLETDVPMTEIGPLCGYANPSYFSTAFKKRYGVSPSRYRTLHKRS